MIRGYCLSWRIMINIKYFCSLVFSILICYNGSSQLYEWKKEVDLPILLSGAGLNTYVIIKEPRIPTPTLEEVEIWSRDEVPAWDRSATYNWDPTAGSWSDHFQHASIAFPLILAASGEARKEYKIVSLMFFETMFFTQGVIGGFKLTVRRRRPYVFNEEAPDGIKYSRQVFYSFISGHTTSIASACFFAANVFQDYHPDSKYRWLVWAGAATLPAVTGFLRYQAGRHFISDVVAGYGIGAVIGSMVPYLHRRNKDSDLSVNVIGIPGGGLLSLNYSF